ncbi:MAG: hypothetical protein RR254_09030, partial [Muribaculaceae bacterium]
MLHDYLFNTINRLIEQRRNNSRSPICITYKELRDEVDSDMRAVLNTMVANSEIIAKTNVNKEPLIYLHDAN